MAIAYGIAASLVSLLLIFSGILLLTKEKGVTKTMTDVGVPLALFPALSALKFAGAMGLLAGIFYRPLGMAAAVGVVLYFAGAVIAHLRVNDVKGIVVPGVLVAVSAVPLILGIAAS